MAKEKAGPGRPRLKASRPPKAFGLRMPPELRARLERISDRERRSLNEQIVYALERWCEGQEVT